MWSHLAGVWCPLHYLCCILTAGVSFQRRMEMAAANGEDAAEGHPVSYSNYRDQQ